MDASVVVPAFNEERVIERCLDSLTDPSILGSPVVFVVCNGCTDETEALARRYEHRGVVVASIEEASKTAALNRGDELAGSLFPRVYVDADVVLSKRSLMQLVDELRRPGALAVEPVPRFDTHASSPCVRAYYAIWVELHGRQAGRIGSGVIGVNRHARERFGAFPDLISDDGFLRRQFGDGEIVYVPATESKITAPRTLSSLIRIKRRSRRGSRQLEVRFPSLRAAERKPFPLRLVRVPLWKWPILPLYFAVTAVIRLERLSSWRTASEPWERDESSRA